MQDLVLRAHVLRLRRECGVTPDGQRITAALPAGISGHFGGAGDGDAAARHRHLQAPVDAAADRRHHQGPSRTLPSGGSRLGAGHPPTGDLISAPIQGFGLLGFAPPGAANFGRSARSRRPVRWH